MRYFGGIEGGATHSKLIICDENGKEVGYASGSSTNLWMIGIPECCKRIADMVNNAKDSIGIPRTQRLTSIGLSLSGCGHEATNKKLENELKKSYPDLSENYVICEDTDGSIYTVSSNGGLVLISGTGSNAVLRNPDGTKFGCGGWGHILGDEGSAWWISHRAVKIVFDDMDNFEKSPFPIDRVWNAIKEHFKVDTRSDLLDYCYAKFDKSFFASLCKKLSELAKKDNDELCLHLFKESGKLLAKSLLALIPKVQKPLTHKSSDIENDEINNDNSNNCEYNNEDDENNDLNIVCVGSVWLSWDLLCDSFINKLNSYNNIPFGLKLVTLTKSMAIGAVYIGADGINYNLPRNYENNYKVFYHYKRQRNQTYNENGSILE